MNALLLLPHPPDPPSFTSIRAAYDTPIDSTLRYLCEHGSTFSSSATLDIALPCSKHALANRGQHFDRIPAQGPRAIDVRVLPLLYDPLTTYTPTWEQPHLLDCLTGLPLLVQSERPWDILFVTDSAEGERLYQHFRSIGLDQRGDGPIQRLSLRPQRVPGGVVLHRPDAAARPDASRMRMHSRVAAVGDFGLLTRSKRLLLTMALFLVERGSLCEVATSIGSKSTPVVPQLLIGVTDPTTSSDGELWGEHGPRPLDERQQAIDEFLRAVSDFRRPPGHCSSSHGRRPIWRGESCIQYEKVSGAYEWAVRAQDVSAVAFADEEMVDHHDAINSARTSKRWDSLTIFLTEPVQYEEDDGDEINERLYLD
ncbi:hypothetical protein LTR53_012318 [Teratosphaeriaceae sp. CCFEE 6253]|nr:hypothetical protein LTR53_012318 [Teratosphaeriaceae sp. CCFEE 6253]